MSRLVCDKNRINGSCASNWRMIANRSSIVFLQNSFVAADRVKISEYPDSTTNCFFCVLCNEPGTNICLPFLQDYLAHVVPYYCFCLIKLFSKFKFRFCALYILRSSRQINVVALLLCIYLTYLHVVGWIYRRYHSLSQPPS